jgi:hypothetical protein
MRFKKRGIGIVDKRWLSRKKGGQEIKKAKAKCN